MKTDLLLESNPFEFSTYSNELFFESLKETALIHYSKNNYLKYLWDKHNVHPLKINPKFDLSVLPYTMVNLFKEFDIFSGAKEDIALTLGSSGTSGQRSQIHLNQESLDRVKKLAYNIHDKLGITSSKKYNYICFTYDPNVANDLGTAFTDELLTNFTDKKEVFYTFKFGESGFYFDEESTVNKLIEFSKSEFSTRILGFPAFLYETLSKYNLNLEFDDDSWVQTGGGWKGKADIEIPKAEFRTFVSERLNIPISNIRDLFGMVEHGIPYVDCPAGKLRVPNYSRVLIRDPRTMKLLGYNEVGLVQFICTYNTSYPAINLLTTDYGLLTNESDGLGDSLRIIGRAGVLKNKGCALKAMEMLK